jgi:hypothetical protein
MARDLGSIECTFYEEREAIAMNKPHLTPIALILIALGAGAAVPPTDAAGAEEESLASCCAVEELLPPVRLEAGGAMIDLGECIAHSGPHAVDLDGDGLQDLLVGDFKGHIHVFRNIGSSEAPAYAAGQLLMAGGEAIKISNW